MSFRSRGLGPAEVAALIPPAKLSPISLKVSPPGIASFLGPQTIGQLVFPLSAGVAAYPAGLLSVRAHFLLNAAAGEQWDVELRYNDVPADGATSRDTGLATHTVVDLGRPVAGGPPVTISVVATRQSGTTGAGTFSDPRFGHIAAVWVPAV